MGTENSVLAECEWGDDIPVSVNSDWKMTKATLKDETAVTIFQHKKKNKKAIDLFERGTKNLKTLRHPDIVKFIGSGENTDGSSYLVTELVEPLESLLPTLSPIELCAGLHSVLEALVFLHHTVGVCHNNVCLSSLFVTHDGSWRLAGLEHACKFQEATSEFLEKCLAFRNTEAIAPEEEEGNIETNTEYGHVRDVYAFGVLAETMLEKLNDLGDSTKTFEPKILDECLNDDPKQRPNLQELLNDRLFRHDFLDILSFLKTVTTKSVEEKKEFFSSITEKLIGLPEELVAQRLIVPLLSRFVVLDDSAKKHMLPNLLTPYRGNKRPNFPKGQKRPILHASLFKLYVIPELHKIFHIRDVHIRLVLLSHFSSYVDLFDKETLEDAIVIQLLLGLRDTSDQLVAASLHALAELVPLLGADVIIGGTRKKFFTEGMPKFGNQGLDSNISGVIGKKMLLKDLAALSNGDVIGGSGEPERRKEKNQRREDARRKREERKMQHREKVLKNSKTCKVIEESSADIIEESPEKKENFNSNMDLSSDVESQSDSVNHELGVSEWDEWSGETENRGYCDDRDFSDEIERELQNMPSTLIIKQSQDICAQNDISECRETTSKQAASLTKLKSALKLGGKYKQQNTPRVHFVDQKPHDTEKQLDWGQTWDHISQTFDTDPQFKSSPHVGTESIKTKYEKQTAVSSNSPLGSEFDVKSIEIKAKPTSELDFFADMTPQIKVTSQDLLTKIGDVNSVLNDKTTHTKGISFAVLNTAESTEDAAGWDDDLDWGTDGL